MSRKETLSGMEKVRKFFVAFIIGIGILGLVIGLILTTFEGGTLPSPTSKRGSEIEIRTAQNFLIPQGVEAEAYDPSLDAVFTANGGRVMVERRDGSVHGCDLVPDTTWKLIDEERIDDQPWAYCPTRELAAIALSDGTIRLRDFSGTGEVRQIPVDQIGGEARQIAFDVSLATTCRLAVATDTSIRVLDPLSGVVRETGPGLPVRNGIALSGAVAATAQGTWNDADGHDTQIEIWRGDETIVVEPGPQEAIGVWKIRLSPDGTRLAADYQRSGLSGVRVWDTSNGELLWESDTTASYWVRSLVFSPHGEQVAAGDEKGRLRIWAADTGRQLLSSEAGGVISALAYSPDGVRLAGVLADERVIVWTMHPAAQPRSAAAGGLL